MLRGTAPLRPTTRALLAGFLLGDTRAVPADVIAAYRGSGLSHLLAVSGENVAFTLALFGPLLRRLTLGPRTVAAVAIVLMFATMTRFEPSVLRATGTGRRRARLVVRGPARIEPPRARRSR